MASPEAEQIHGVMRQMAGLLAEPTVDLLRMVGEQFGMMTGPAGGVTREPVELAGLKTLRHAPDGAVADRAILYIHGGGFVAGSAEAWGGLVDHLARQVGVTAYNVDYRLAPEEPYPAALDDTVGAYRALLDQGFAPQHIALAGDSAGGGLVLAALARLRDEGALLPAAAVCFSPYADGTVSAESLTRNAERDFLMTAAVAEMCWNAYLGTTDPKNPSVSPVFADFTGFPPLLLQVGDAEVLLDDSVTIAQRAEIAGVDVTLDVWPDMQHVFVVCAGNVPEADRALATVGAFLRAHLGL